MTDINDTLGSEVDALSEGLQEALDMVDSNRNDSLRLSEAIAEMNNTRLTPDARKLIIHSSLIPMADLKSKLFCSNVILRVHVSHEKDWILDCVFWFAFMFEGMPLNISSIARRRKYFFGIKDFALRGQALWKFRMNGKLIKKPQRHAGKVLKLRQTWWDQILKDQDWRKIAKNSHHLNMDEYKVDSQTTHHELLKL